MTILRGPSRRVYAAMLVALAACGSPTPPVARPTATVVPRPTASPTPARAVFKSSAEPLSSALRQRMTAVSWKPGCPVALDGLRLVTMTYRSSDGAIASGQLVVNADAVQAITSAFRVLFNAHYPITRMRLIDDYSGDDERSMNADNTSAFNCRRTTGASSWSQHAYGRAVDINPFENPLVGPGIVDPPSAKRYTDRSAPGRKLIHHGDAAWQAFADVGWEWGGDFKTRKDYQHFSANGL